MAEREWLPDPTGRHPYRSRTERCGWSDLVAAGANGEAASSDAPGGRMARDIDRPKVNPYRRPEPTVAQLNGRNQIGVVLGLIVVAAMGVWLLVDLIFSPYEICNSFRCIRRYDTGGTLLGLGLTAGGGWLGWSSQQTINRRIAEAAAG